MGVANYLTLGVRGCVAAGVVLRCVQLPVLDVRHRRESAARLPVRTGENVISQDRSCEIFHSNVKAVICIHYGATIINESDLYGGT